ncbi:ABC-type transport system involved in resistance to organic solvents, periplasmic component [Nostoc sp. PCC 7524]|uniref:MlaD family protein n=1 Tax=Nostoc sp. (strain ATCC 29411 / PCC 7524) TaxID=28072 RepID=UPI00029F2125|nr:MlaD family protein [Nostoc sp. PCC 7524]AFY47311.1 ABC-type transport system involved in resistance to organic solvents, periplasmic component [Nostoc sp. PCC 7524]
MRDFITSRFASKRTLREGSVGLLVLLGLGAFVVIILWLNRFTAARSSYKATVEFANAGGMQRGAPVRYRGVKIGNISRIQPGPNAVEVEIEIAQSDLIIPRDVVIEANQSGLISESIIDITPKTSLPTGETIAKPLDKNCNPSLIVCNGSRLKGQIGISLDELIRSTTELATVYNNPEFYQRVNKLLETSSEAATGVAALSRDIRSLSKSFQGQLGTFANTANSVQKATTALTASTTKTVDQLGVTASQFGTTATQASKLLTDLDNLVNTNRSVLVGTLNNIAETSNQLRVTVTTLSPALNRLTQGELLNNLESLSANAAQASANLRDATKALNDPKNAVLLQQTLDSARVTFENTQKITSDLDELTGDPNFRQNLRQLVNGLSTLVSSTDQMQQQVQVAATLESAKAAVNQSEVAISPPTPKQKALTTKPAPVAIESTVNPPQTSQQRLLQQLREYRGSRE